MQINRLPLTYIRANMYNAITRPIYCKVRPCEDPQKIYIISALLPINPILVMKLYQYGILKEIGRAPWWMTPWLYIRQNFITFAFADEANMRPSSLFVRPLFLFLKKIRVLLYASRWRNYLINGDFIVSYDLISPPFLIRPCFCRSIFVWIGMRYSRGPLSVAEEVEGRENDEKRLLRHLMRGYERDVRPVKNASTPVVIQLSITLTQIFDMVSQQKTILRVLFQLDQHSPTIYPT